MFRPQRYMQFPIIRKSIAEETCDTSIDISILTKAEHYDNIIFMKDKNDIDYVARYGSSDLDLLLVELIYMKIIRLMNKWDKINRK